MSDNAPEIRVRSLAEISDLLNRPQRALRIAACNAIIAAPDKARALRSEDDRDVVDAVIETFEKAAEEDRIALLNVLQHFPGRRLEALLRALLRFETSDSLLHLAARLVDSCRIRFDATYWLELLRDTSSFARVRIAAQRIPEASLAVEDRIIAAAFAERAIEFPEVSEETLPDWRNALEGPFSEYLLLSMERRGPALSQWCEVWDRLDAWLQHWLVRIACCQHPPQEAVIRRALEADNDDIVAMTSNAVRLYQPVLSDDISRQLAGC